MKKSRPLFLAFFLLIGIGLFVLLPHFYTSPIVKILKTEPYSYLSNEAKEYIKEVYEESGEIIHTEVNKEDNEPYLNPKYVEYLNSTPEERESVEVIPTPLIIDYVESEPIAEDSASIPSTYDLRNVNGKNFITPIKNQGSLNLCWAFTSAEQIESYLMVKSNTTYNANTTTILSPRQLDYAGSTDGIKDYTNDYGTRVLTDGGNFLTSTIVGFNGVGFTSESYMPFNYSTDQKELYEVLNYSNSLYEVDGSVMMPKLTSSSTSSQISAFVADVKQLIMNNGGVYVGTQGPGYSCSVNVSSNSALIRVDDGCVENSGHAMQIIGWNDNYSYSYCKSSSQTHTTNTSGCDGTVVSGTGAWILRNSWGNSYPYVYLAYDSINDDLYSFSSVSSMSNKNWDNNYHKDLESFRIYYGTTDTQTFQKKIKTSEKIQKIKFFSFGSNGTFKLSINTPNKSYSNIMTATVAYPGVYTFDLSGMNYVIDEDQFYVTVESSNGVYLAKKSIAVFTSNVDSTPIIQSNVSNIQLDSLNSNYSTRLYSNTKNIPSNSTIQYSLWNSGNTNVTSSYLTVSNNVVAKNDVNTSLTIKSTIPNGRYTLKLTYGSTTEEIPVLIGDPATYQVRYFANGGSGTMAVDTVEELTSYQIKYNSYTRTGYRFSNWNTAQDGTGNTYLQGDTISSMTQNLNLYAQWIPNNFYLQFIGNGGTGSMPMQKYTYDVSQNISTNIFTRENYVFTGWNTKEDGTGTSYEDEQSVKNLSSSQNMIINLYAQWEYRKENLTITYNSNGGIGTMTDQVVHNSTAFVLNNNTFTRTDYTFTGWNTKSDGTGTSYSNQQSFPNGITTDMTLYAQWQREYVTITFKPNTGTGTMSNQRVRVGNSFTINANQFTKEDYDFVGWNTKSDGTGTSYSNQQVISSGISDDMTLYAQWQKAYVYITFNANTGSGSMSNQRVRIGNSFTINANQFTKEDYDFVGWNTKSDGSGTSYSNQQVISNGISANLTLYAQWQKAYVYITFNANGGSGSMSNQRVRIGESFTINANQFTKTDYAFVEWNTKSNGSGTSYDNQQVVSSGITGNITLYAQWQEWKENLTITFNANGGSGTMANQVVRNSTAFVLNNNTYTREDYTFTGWNTKSDGSGTSYSNQQSFTNGISADMTLYAQWQKEYVSITFKPNTGSGSMSNQRVRVGTSFTINANQFTKTNYDFVSWNTKSDGTGTSYSDQQVISNGITADMTLYAQWQKSYFTVTFYANNGTQNSTTQSVRRATTFTLNNNTFERTGYLFNGWNTKSDGTGNNYSNQQTITGGISADLNLYAKWNPIHYTIIFQANGGEGSMSNQTMTYDTSASLNDNQFTKEGYQFTGWNTKSDGSGTSYTNRATVNNLTTTNNAQITLYAQWQEKPASTYTINHYVVDQNKHYIDKIEAKTSLTKYKSYFDLGEGYTISIDLGSKNYVYTGSVVKIYYQNTLVETYTNIVRGDANGDGIINSGDLLSMVNHLKGTATLKNAYFTASDCNYDSIINSGDLLKVVNYLKGTGTI